MPPPRSRPAANVSDHDLLIRIDTKLEMLTASVSQNHSEFTQRLNELDKEKANNGDIELLRATIRDQQVRADGLAEKVDWTRRMLWIAIGAMAALNIIGPFAVALAMRNPR